MSWFILEMQEEREWYGPHLGKICGELVQTNVREKNAFGLIKQREYTLVCAVGEMRSGPMNGTLSR